MTNQRWFWIGAALLAAPLGLFAAVGLHSSQPVAVMDSKPKHRWDIAVWLQLNEETITTKLRSQSPELSDKEFAWSHVKVDYQVLHGTALIPGKNKFYVADVPTFSRGTLWIARDGKVVTGYKRKVAFSENPDGFVVVTVDRPRIKADKLIYAPMTTLYVDDEGKIYF